MTNVVADSSPLIYLAELADFQLLSDLFGTIDITRAVFEEVVTKGRGPVVSCVRQAIDAARIRIVDLDDAGAATAIAERFGLHPGESESIALLRQRKSGLLLA